MTDKRHTAKLTHKTDKKPVVINVDRQKIRLEENKAHLKNSNVIAFLKTIAWAEGGGYDFKFGAHKDRKNDRWRFTDNSTHPGAGIDGRTTAAGMYQITQETWKEKGITAMGLSDFTPSTQDLIAVEILRSIGAIDYLEHDDFDACLKKAAMKWNALPLGKGLKNRVTTQHYEPYNEVLEKYSGFGGKMT